jgi:RNA polymerase-binding transcription factor DksA
MVDTASIRDQLKKQADELRGRIDTLQQAERSETAEGQTDAAHLWENADLRADELDEAVGELRDIDAALSRVDEGTYGVCVTCGKPIGDERLDFLPTTTVCASHAT